MNRAFLIFHSILLIIAGIGGANASLVGYYFAKGIFKFLHNQNSTVVGLFEAYLLACVCGVLLLAGSKYFQTKSWHLLAALVHVPLIATNLLFWNFYSDFNLLNIGIIATAAHFIFIFFELFYFLTKTHSKYDK